MLDIRRDQDVSQAEDSMVAGIPARREEREKKKKKKKKKREREREREDGSEWYYRYRTVWCIIGFSANSST